MFSKKKRLDYPQFLFLSFLPPRHSLVTGRSDISSGSSLLLLLLFQDRIPTTTKTMLFQKPRSDPVKPTMSSKGYEEKPGLAKEATRLVDGATQTKSSARKKKRGIRMYCRKEREDGLEGMTRVAVDAA